MLDKYPGQLYIDTSVRDAMLMENGQLVSSWKDLFVTHSDQFLVAIDTFYTPRWENIGKVTQAIRNWLSFLPEGVARKLAYENASRLFLDNNSH